MLDAAKSWCILQTSGAATLSLASTLADAGFEVWTPSTIMVRRVGRRRERLKQPAPLMPTYVFARYDRIGELLAFARSEAKTFLVFDKDLRRMVRKGCPHFRVFRHDGMFPAIADHHLDALRQAEQRGRPLQEVRLFEPGEAVKYPQAGFEGLAGVVQSTRGRNVLVCFEGFAIPVTVPAKSLVVATAAS